MDDSVGVASCQNAEEQSLYSYMLQASKKLRVQDIMSKEVVTVCSSDTVQRAAQAMSEHHLWCLPVVDDDIFKGIITQSLVLHEITGGSSDSGDDGIVGEQMQSASHWTSPEISVLDVSWIMEEARVKWLPVLAEEHLVGVITQSDVTRALISPLRFTDVASIMNPDVVAVYADASVSEAATIMVNENISCLIVMHHGRPSGILTSADVIEKVVAAKKDSRDLLVADIMSFPIASILPSECLVTANKIMDRKRVRRLVAMEGDRICGIITQTDILRSLKEALLREELDHIDEQEFL